MYVNVCIYIHLNANLISIVTLKIICVFNYKVILFVLVNAILIVYYFYFLIKMLSFLNSTRHISKGIEYNIMMVSY